MNYLLDTHTFIWFVNGDKQLSANAKKMIESKGANNFISIGSLWEIAIKVSLGKLKMNVPLVEVPEQISKNGFQILPVTFEDTLLLSTFPFHHRDPFDRLIIAQSFTNKLTIISKDEQFKNYGVIAKW